MTDAERTKLTGIAAGANNYSHPVSHPASMVEESTTRKFMTDTEKTLLSTLGTKAVQITGENLGQNGYVKYLNGLLIQWGKGGGYTTYHTYYLPMSFLDINYSFSICAEYKNLSESVILSPYVNNKTRTTFVSGITATNISNGVLPSNWNFFWIAIGRWK